MADKIKCPKCGKEISIDEAIVQKMVNLRVQKERPRLKEEIEKEHQDDQNSKIQLLEKKFFYEKKKREEAEKKELELRLKEEAIIEKEKKIDLEIQRRTAEGRKDIEEKITKEKEEKFLLKIAEKNKQLEDTKKALFEAQRKAHQGSMQTQGEVLELSLEELLKKKFPFDKIDPVPKGISGADIIQTVYSHSNQPAGTIVWESKQTKNWTEDWIQKLKDDSRQIKADIAVLVSNILPKEINNFGLYHGIWVCNRQSIYGLTTALRNQILAIHNTITVNTGKEEKMEILYDHLCSPGFAQKIEIIVETFINMQRTLEKEKIAMNKIWTVREVQIKRLQDSTIKMYGEIQGIAGKALPDIKLLELGEIDEVKKPSKKEKDVSDSQSNLF